MTLDFWTLYLNRFPLWFGTESIAPSIFEISKAKKEFDIFGETLLDLIFLQLPQIFRWLIESSSFTVMYALTRFLQLYQSRKH